MIELQNMRIRRLAKRREEKKRKLLVFLALLALFLFFFVYLPYRKIKAKGGEVLTSARTVSASFKNNDIDEVEKNLAELEGEYAAFQKSARRVYFLRFVPVLGGYILDFKNGVEAGDHLIQAAKLAVDAIAPYADLIGFKKGTAFVEKSADERIQTAVLTLDKVLVKVDDISNHIEEAEERIKKIDEGRYPKKLGRQEIRPKLKKIKEQFEGIASLFVDAKPLLKKTPSILGTEEEKTYLILFQNDKELRPTGGFLTAYAIFKVRNGKFSLVKSEDIYTLDQSIPSHPRAPDEILAYHKDVSRFNIRDSNLSPDFVESLKLFNSLYEKSSQRQDYDGVFAVDTYVLVDTLRVLGDTEVNGVVFSAKEDKRCDCPQVIYQLLDLIDRPVAFQKENRKGILGDLLYVLMQKALGFSPSQYWGKLSQDLIKNLQEKHILVYLEDGEAQKSIEKINFGGRIRDFDGDYLHINDTNFAGAKSNLFVSHTIRSDTTIEKDGTVERTLTIDYRNPYPHSDCSLERGGLCLNATLRNWLRIFVPKGAKLLSFKGSETKVKTYDDLSKTVFEGFIRVQPKGKATVIVSYQLPFKVKDGNYRLLIQKQPGTQGHQYNILLNGKEKEKITLTEDREIQFD